MQEESIKLVSTELELRTKKGQLILPMLPQVAQKVLVLSNGANSDFQQLAELIQKDPSLAAQVMRVASSAAFSAGVEIQSLQQAITRLGMKTLAEIAISSAVSEHMFDAPGYEKLVHSIWQRSISIALWSREIARQLRLNIESVFLAGLLHQMGAAVAVQSVLAIANEHKVHIDEVSVNTLVQHYTRPLGIELTRQWQLPEVVSESINYVFTGECAAPFSQAAMVVSAATSFEQDAEEIAQSDAVIALNLYPDDVEELQSKRTDIEQSQRMFLA